MTSRIAWESSQKAVCHDLCFSLDISKMPGTKSRTIRQKKCWARGCSARKSPRAVSSPQNVSDSPAVEVPSSVPLSPNVSDSPAVEVPSGVPLSPNVSDSPAVEVPSGVPLSPNVSDSPAVEVPSGVPLSPNVPDSHAVEVPSGVPLSPNVSDSPAVEVPSGVPLSPNVSDSPEVEVPSGVPLSPNVSDSPAVKVPSGVPLSPNVSDSPAVEVPSGVPLSSTTPKVVTASKKKLSKSPYGCFDDHAEDSGSSSDSDGEVEGQGCRLFELDGLIAVFKNLHVACGKCGHKGLEYKEDFLKRQGLYTAPCLFCKSCHCRVPIPFSTVGSSKVFKVNRKVALANKCAGGSYAGLRMFFGMLDLPMPVSKHVHTMHIQEIEKQAKLQAEDSMSRAREEVRRLYGTEGGDVVDVLVSCDGTWQKRGFSSLFGAVFVIEYETGKVVDFVVKSKFCKACKHWEKAEKKIRGISNMERITCSSL